MINIKVQTNGLLELKAKLAGMADKQVAFTTSRALNAAAYAATKPVGKEIEPGIRPPDLLGLKSVRYTKSDKRNLTATVDFDFWSKQTGRHHGWRRVLRAEIYGGSAKTSGMRSHCRKQNSSGRDGIVPGDAATRTRTET